MEPRGQFVLSDEPLPVSAAPPDPPPLARRLGSAAIEMSSFPEQLDAPAGRVDRVVEAAEAIVAVVAATTALISAVCELTRAFQSLHDLRKQRA